MWVTSLAKHVRAASFIAQVMLLLLGATSENTLQVTLSDFQRGVYMCVCAHAHVHMSWPQLLPTFNHLSKMYLLTCKNLHIPRPLNSSKFLSPFRALLHKEKSVVVLLAVVAGGSSFIIFLQEELPEDEISIRGWARSPPSWDPTPRPPASQAGFRRAPESQLAPSGCLPKSRSKKRDICRCQGSRAGTGNPSQQRIRESVFAALWGTWSPPQQLISAAAAGSGKAAPTICKQTCLAVFQ